MKRIIALVLCFVAVMSLFACGSSPSTTKLTPSAQNEDKNEQTGTLPYFKTEDWLEFQPTVYNEKSETGFSVNLPEGWFLDGTVIMNHKSEKVGEFVGLIELENNTVPFSSVNLNENYADNIYTEKDNLKIGSYYAYLLKGTGATEKGDWNICSYALVLGDCALLVNFYSFEKLDSSDSMYTDALQSFKLL